MINSGNNSYSTQETHNQQCKCSKLKWNDYDDFPQQKQALQYLRWQQQYIKLAEFKTEDLEELTSSSLGFNSTTKNGSSNFLHSSNCSTKDGNNTSTFGLELSLDSVLNHQTSSSSVSNIKSPCSSSLSSSTYSLDYKHHHRSYYSNHNQKYHSNNNSNSNNNNNNNHNLSKDEFKWKYHQYQPSSLNFLDENKSNRRFSDYVAAVNQQNESQGKKPAFFSWMSLPLNSKRNRTGQYLTPRKLNTLNSPHRSSGIQKKRSGRRNSFDSFPYVSSSSSPVSITSFSRSSNNNSPKSLSSSPSSSSPSPSTSPVPSPSTSPNNSPPSSPQVLKNLIKSHPEGFKRVGRIRRRKQNKDYDNLVTCFVKTRSLTSNSKTI